MFYLLKWQLPTKGIEALLERLTETTTFPVNDDLPMALQYLLLHMPKNMRDIKSITCINVTEKTSTHQSGIYMNAGKIAWLNCDTERSVMGAYQLIEVDSPFTMDREPGWLICLSQKEAIKS